MLQPLLHLLHVFVLFFLQPDWTLVFSVYLWKHGLLNFENVCCLKYVCARVHVYLKHAFKWAVGLLFRLCVQRLKLGLHASV